MASRLANEMENGNENRLANKLDKMRSPRKAMVTFEQMKLAIAATRNQIGIPDDETEVQYRERAKRTLVTVFAMTSCDAGIVAPSVNLPYNEKFKLSYTPKEMSDKTNGLIQNATDAVAAGKRADRIFDKPKEMMKMNNEVIILNENAAEEMAAGRRRAGPVFGSIAAMNLALARDQKQLVQGDNYNGMLAKHGAAEVHYLAGWPKKMDRKRKRDDEDDGRAERKGRGRKLVVVGSEVES